MAPTITIALKVESDNWYPYAVSTYKMVEFIKLEKTTKYILARIPAIVGWMNWLEIAEAMTQNIIAIPKPRIERAKEITRSITFPFLELSF